MTTFVVIIVISRNFHHEYVIEIFRTFIIDSTLFPP